MQDPGAPAQMPHASLLNRMLALVPTDLVREWLPQLQRVQLAPLQVLESRGPLQHVLFPLTCVVSVQCIDSDGTATQIALVGRDGMLGLCALAGGDSGHLRHVTIGAGEALRLPLHALEAAARLERCRNLRELISRYFHLMLLQASQMAVCNRHHPPQAQLATALLLASDQWRAGVLQMTHEMLSSMLGVRRETVSQAAHRLQEQGLLRYRRGRVEILDRLGLTHAACHCHAVITAETSRLLGGLTNGNGKCTPEIDR